MTISVLVWKALLNTRSRAIGTHIVAAGSSHLIGMPGTTWSTRGSARAALMRHGGRLVFYNGVHSIVLIAACSTSALLQQAADQQLDGLSRCC